MLRKILSLALILVLGLTSPAFAKSATVEQLFNDTAVASTAVVTSRILNIQNGGYFGVHYKATSASSAPDLKIEFLMSSTCKTTSTDFIEPSGASDIETNLTGETWVVKSITPPPMPCFKIQVTGNAGNPADTLLNLRLFIQEP